jgi:hypothetical protein
MSFVQSKANQLGSAAITVAATYNSPVVPGNLLIAAVNFNSVDTVTVADSVNGAWTAIAPLHTGTGGVSTVRMQFFYFPNTAAGTPTVTATASGSHVPFGIAIFEYSGQSIIDAGVNYSDVLASTTPATPTLTTTGPSDLVFAAVVTSAQGTGANAPFTFREGANWGGNGTADNAVAAPGNYSCTFTTSSGDAMLGIVAFQAAVSSLEPIEVGLGR